MFPCENNQSKVKINVAKYIKDRDSFNKGKHLNFALFQDYLSKQKKQSLKYHYTHGMCGVLATVMHQLTGWPVVEVFDMDSLDVLHVGVINPKTALYTDAHGTERTKEQFEKFWPRSNDYFGAGDLDDLAPKTDYFIPEVHKQYYYPMCLLEHVPVLLPKFKPLVKQIESSYTSKA